MAKKRKLLVPDEINGAWAIMPTPATPGADDWRNANTVDVEESARVVDQLIRSGIDGILSLGTLGECSTLTWDEKKTFMQTIVDAAAGRVPVFVGTTALGTRDSIAHTRAAADIGADGTMLGIPMWCGPDLPTAVQFYRDVAEACPDMNIAIYANHEAFKFGFPPPFWKQVADIPQVVTAKYIGVAQLMADLRAVGKKMRLLPIDGEYYGAARIDPDAITAFWSATAVCGPSIATALRDRVAAAKKSGDWTAAREVADDLFTAGQGFFPEGDRRLFGMYNIALEKTRMTAAGWMNAGPIRPPYHMAPEKYLAAARTVGERLAVLRAKYDGLASGAPAAAQ